MSAGKPSHRTASLEVIVSSTADPSSLREFSMRFPTEAAFSRVMGLAVHACERPIYDELYCAGRQGGWVHASSSDLSPHAESTNPAATG